ncbi:MAG: GMC family oxidoreductase N-terminal domain-containing protein [Casimicrobiaceae bacterium]
MYVASIPDGASFDYVIVGSGSAGCVLANRLTADGRHTVLLMEAGGRDNHYNIRIPMLVADVLSDTRWTWPYVTAPQPHLDGKPRKWIRGKVIGGCSSINGNLFVRGDPAEFDAWRDALGCEGWGYADLLPIFMRLEDCPEGDPASRGSGGPIRCTRPRGPDTLSDAFVDACAEAGSRRLGDYNDGSYEGAFLLQYSIRKGLRDSSASGYLRQAIGRRNLTVLPNATATRIAMDGRRATGVEYRAGGRIGAVKSTREVVLSAGPLASPQLLELSGIGNGDLLRELGVPGIHHLPGVGENLRDHPNMRMTFECSKPVTINDVMRSPLRKAKEALRFALMREGILAMSSSSAQMNYRSRPDVRRADMVLRLLRFSGESRYSRRAGYGLDRYPGFTIGVAVLQPRSTGTVHIESRDPMQQARMDPRYLAEPDDARMFVEGMRFARRVAAMPSLKPLVVRETRPGADADDDAALLQYAREAIQTSWHMVGTTKMGIDAMAVVDPQLRVHGIASLRVIDSGICPTIPSSNTNIPAIAIGEKGADLLLATA